MATGASAEEVFAGVSHDVVADAAGAKPCPVDPTDHRDGNAVGLSHDELGGRRDLVDDRDFGHLQLSAVGVGGAPDEPRAGRAEPVLGDRPRGGGSDVGVAGKDQVIVDGEVDGGVVDHIDRVLEPPSTGTVRTVEGNTSATGSQNNGGAVLVKDRPLSICTAFVRDS